MEKITYTIEIEYEQNRLSDKHYPIFKEEVKNSLTKSLPATVGTAEARVVSIREK